MMMNHWSFRSNGRCIVVGTVRGQSNISAAYVIYSAVLINCYGVTMIVFIHSEIFEITHADRILIIIMFSSKLFQKYNHLYI